MATVIGNGGANYNTADGELRKKLVQNQMNIKNDPSYGQSEIARTLQVIKDRQAAGQDVSAQQKYLTSNLGYKAPSAPSAPSASSGAALSNNTVTPNTNSQVSNELMNSIREMAQRQSQPFSYDPNSDPNYQAALQRARSNIDQGNSAAQAEMNRRGILNSTITSDRMGEIASNEMGRVETDVLPQLMQAAYQRYQNDQAQQQQQLSNLMNTAQMYINEDQRGIDNRNTTAGLTGYLPTTPEAQQYIDAILKLKQQAEAPGITAAGRKDLSTQADQYRALLANMGVNSASYGANVGYNQASQVPSMMRTMQGQQLDLQKQQQQWDNNFSQDQFAYQKARDLIKDKQWQQQFDQDVKQAGLQYALSRQVQLGGLSIDQARLALSQDDNARQWAALDWDMTKPQSGGNRGLSANQVLQSMKSLYTDPIYDSSQSKVGSEITKDPTKRESMFLNVVDSGLSDAETNQILNSLGFSKKEIDKYMKQYSGN